MEWRGLAGALGRPDWLTNPKYAEAVTRWLNRKDLDTEVAAWTRDRKREDVTRILQAAGVAAFPSFTSQDIVDDPHLNQRGAIQSLSGPEGQSRKVVGPPWLFSRTPGSLDTWTPKLGEHNHYVFGELLGLTRDEIDTLIREKVIY
jgi:benzylsuccinate CoA-transferase BbsF subunit